MIGSIVWREGVTIRMGYYKVVYREVPGRARLDWGGREGKGRITG